MTNEALTSLHTALIDTREGYRTAIGKVDDAETLAQLRSADQLHAAAHADLHGVLVSRGVELDEDGSLMGTVHKAVVSVRSATLGLDEGSLASFASGEEHNLKAYDEAIGEETDTSVIAKLTGHRDALAVQATMMKQRAESA